MVIKTLTKYIKEYNNQSENFNKGVIQLTRSCGRKDQ